ncbi:DUF4913 domain-containing protein [Clavibacter michiganensis]|uniref:DUF4913 domain-containing protein n=1 Tax=Clavibacter michiganensis TaxID=28447 RepID=UPI000CE8F3D3|nr:DUF4913 domain-containing protein [Clavibacter michiganensis]
MTDQPAEWDDPAAEIHDSDAPASSDPDARELAFANVYEFVDEWLLPRYRRKPGLTQWDPRWFENLEALDRLEALWRSFEYMRYQGMTGMQVFWTDHHGPTMRELTHPDGVFWYLTDYDTQVEPPLLRSDRPPEEILE